jgi:thiol-disulfide isomerase/thioredoxin
MEKTTIAMSLIIGLMLVGVVSASSVSFYYSPTCPHCEAVAPLVQQLSQQRFSTNWKWSFFDVSKQKYDVEGVPTIKIKTSDCRDIILVGSGEIPRYLKCELQEQSTKECMTSIQLNPATNSYFR